MNYPAVELRGIKMIWIRATLKLKGDKHVYSLYTNKFGGYAD